MTYCLFEGRHQLPTNDGPICEEFLFSKRKTVPTDNWTRALLQLRKGETIKIYVTGLTASLTEFLAEARQHPGTIILFHYDRESNTYWEQIF